MVVEGAPGRILTICTPAGNIVGVELVVVAMLPETCCWLRVLVIVARPAPVTEVEAAASPGDMDCNCTVVAGNDGDFRRVLLLLFVLLFMIVVSVCISGLYVLIH